MRDYCSSRGDKIVTFPAGTPESLEKGLSAREAGRRAGEGLTKPLIY